MNEPGFSSGAQPYGELPRQPSGAALRRDKFQASWQPCLKPGALLGAGGGEVFIGHVAGFLCKIVGGPEVST